MSRRHCFRVCACVWMFYVCACAPPVDEYAHQHQQTEDGESGDDRQRNDGPLLPLDTSDQPDARLVAAVSALWWSVRDAQKQESLVLVQGIYVIDPKRHHNQQVAPLLASLFAIIFQLCISSTIYFSIFVTAIQQWGVSRQTDGAGDHLCFTVLLHHCFLFHPQIWYCLHRY